MSECMERAKEVVKIFKQLAISSLKDKTVLAVSHGAFLACLYCLITQQTHDETYIPHNNSLMIIDFEEVPLIHSNGSEHKVVNPKLRAFNLQVIEN